MNIQTGWGPASNTAARVGFQRRICHNTFSATADHETELTAFMDQHYADHGPGSTP